MSDPSSKLVILTRTPAHTLRTTCIFTFPPAFILLLLHGILSNCILPAIGLLPLFFSTMFSIFVLVSAKNTKRVSGTLGYVVCDALAATGLLIVLVLSWVSDMGDRYTRWYANPGFIILGTYGSVFLLFNFVIHILFIGNQLRAMLGSASSGEKSCPYCQHCLHSRSAKKTNAPGVEYAPLVDEEETLRISVDETVVDAEMDMV